MDGRVRTALVDVERSARPARPRHSGWSGWSWRGEERGGGGSEHCEGAGLRGLSGAACWGGEETGRKPGCGRELHEVPASLLSALRIYLVLSADVYIRTFGKYRERANKLKITCIPVGETDLRALSRNSRRGRDGVRRALEPRLAPCP